MPSYGKNNGYYDILDIETDLYQLNWRLLNKYMARTNYHNNIQTQNELWVYSLYRLLCLLGSFKTFQEIKM